MAENWPRRQRQPMTKRGRRLHWPKRPEVSERKGGAGRETGLKARILAAWPESDDGVAVDGDHIPAVRGDNVDDAAEVVVQCLAETLGAVRPGGGYSIGHRSRVDDVDEQHDAWEDIEPSFRGSRLC